MLAQVQVLLVWAVQLVRALHNPAEVLRRPWALLPQTMAVQTDAVHTAVQPLAADPALPDVSPPAPSSPRPPGPVGAQGVPGCALPPAAAQPLVRPAATIAIAHHSVSGGSFASVADGPSLLESPPQPATGGMLVPHPYLPPMADGLCGSAASGIGRAHV